MDRLLEGYERFRDMILPQQAHLFRRLGEGQRPRALVLCCVDSRVDPCLFTQSEPGVLMVMRTAGNLVPELAAGGEVSGGSEVATVHFAIAEAGVRQLIVCGHSGCAALGCLVEPPGDPHLRAMRDWVEWGRPALERVREREPELRGPALREALARENVRLQCERLARWPIVAEALRAGTLELHGWYFSIPDGALECWDVRAGAFREVRSRLTLA